jgi:DNA-binding beta-propeller fold protein YncE
VVDYVAMRTVLFALAVCSGLYAASGFQTLTDKVSNPYGLSIGPDGALYICEIGSHVVSRLDLKTKELTTVAGNRQKGYAGDGGLATEATLNEPYEIRFDKAGNLYFVDMQNNVVQRVDRTSKKISTIAGNGSAGFSGDGGPATQAQFKQPHSIAFDHEGNLLVCDIGNNRIRRIDSKTGIINTFAGTGEKKPTPDGAPLAGTALNGPRAIDVDAKGNLYLALREGNAIYRIDPVAKLIALVAGTGEKGYTGDGGPAVQAKLSGPKGVALSPDGGLYIADTESHTIRRIDLKTGVIRTVLGDGTRGPLARPHGVFVDSKGVLYVDDSENNRTLMLAKP